MENGDPETKDRKKPNRLVKLKSVQSPGRRSITYDPDGLRILLHRPSTFLRNWPRGTTHVILYGPGVGKTSAARLVLKRRAN